MTEWCVCVIIVLCAGTAAENAIRAAMDQFMLDTCIRFIPKNPFHFDYLYFFSGTG